MKIINVAVDGPAGAGKSTVSREAARRLGYAYVDTGALYRAVGWYAASQGADPRCGEQVSALLPRIRLELHLSEEGQRVFLNGEDVSGSLRTPEVSAAASAVAAVPEVRNFLFDTQREIARTQSVVMDGRDIGTVVLPDAQVKVFLTASPEARAQRRYLELKEKNGGVPPLSLERILEEMTRRDQADSQRETAPLAQAEDAVLLDSSHLTPEETVSRLVEIVLHKIEGE